MHPNTYTHTHTHPYIYRKKCNAGHIDAGHIHQNEDVAFHPKLHILHIHTYRTTSAIAGDTGIFTVSFPQHFSPESDQHFDSQNRPTRPRLSMTHDGIMKIFQKEFEPHSHPRNLPSPSQVQAKSSQAKSKGGQKRIQTASIMIIETTRKSPVESSPQGKPSRRERENVFKTDMAAITGRNSLTDICLSKTEFSQKECLRTQPSGRLFRATLLPSRIIKMFLLGS